MEKEKRDLVPQPLLRPWRLCSRVVPLCTKERGNTATVVFVLCPSHARLLARNGLVSEVEFLGLITQKW